MCAVFWIAHVYVRSNVVCALTLQRRKCGAGRNPETRHNCHRCDERKSLDSRHLVSFLYAAVVPRSFSGRCFSRRNADPLNEHLEGCVASSAFHDLVAAPMAVRIGFGRMSQPALTGQITVPFVDLNRMNEPIRAELLEAVSALVDSGAFVNGPAGRLVRAGICRRTAGPPTRSASRAASTRFGSRCSPPGFARETR